MLGLASKYLSMYVFFLNAMRVDISERNEIRPVCPP